jgi:hypothetical protein
VWKWGFVITWLLGCNIEPYVILDVCLNMLNFGHKGCLIVLCSVAHDIRLCRLACAGIEVASHDPSWNSTNGLSPCGHFLG